MANKTCIFPAFLFAACLVFSGGCGRPSNDAVSSDLSETSATWQPESDASEAFGASVPGKALNDLVYRELSGQKLEGDETVHIPADVIRSACGSADTLLITKNGTVYDRIAVGDEDFDIYLEYCGTYSFYLLDDDAESAPVDITSQLQFTQISSADESPLLPLS